ncbi:hypothetical protein FNJ47_48495, partial [Bradyrhizobium sp. UFLA 03-164]|nr:hypothetical protein [Bradyrhizobium uaiense]
KPASIAHKANTPTGVISLRMERPKASIASKAQREGISLRLINPNCPICGGLGWVCENHPHLAWTKDPRGCQCGAGMRCACN